MDLGLRGKIAVVTGASRGLGFATARLLAQEGAQVVINSRNSERLNRAAEQISRESGSEVLAIAGDVTNAEFPSALVQRTVERFWRTGFAGHQYWRSKARGFLKT